MPDGMAGRVSLRTKTGGGAQRHPCFSTKFKVVLAERQGWRCCGCGCRVGLKRDMEESDQSLDRLGVFVPQGSRYEPHDRSNTVIACETCIMAVRAEWAGLGGEINAVPTDAHKGYGHTGDNERNRARRV
jgi:hypothetical protein